jgi:linearmycin/streptolysin S transport system permease protein
MKKIFAIAWKNIINQFSDKSELLFFIILPVVFTVAISAVGGGQNNKKISLLVVDQDNSPFSSELVTELRKSESVEIKEVGLEEAQKQFDNKKAPIWLTIPAGFERSLLSGTEGTLELHKLPRNNDANTVEQGTINSAVSTVSRALAVARNSLQEAEFNRQFASAEEKQAYFTAGLSAAQQAFKAAPHRVKVTYPSDAKQTGFSMAAQASTGQLVTWVFIPLLGISALLVWERESHTLQRLVTTPTNKATFLFGTLSGALGTALVQMIILVCFGIFVLKLDWGNSVAGLAVMLLSFGLASAALGTALGTFVKTSKQAGNLGIALGMAMSLLGGAWLPSELFPQAVRNVMKVLPTSWAMQGFNDLALRGKGLGDILPIAGVLLCFTVVFLTIGVLRFRYE